MDEKKSSYQTGFASDALKEPRRVVFVTKKTSAKVKGEVPGEVMSYPHLVLREAIAFLVLTMVLVLLALVWDAPLEQLANPLVTPNPAKAPWYFLGLQELLHYYPPLIAGIIIPTLVVIALVIIPYFNVNVQGNPLWTESSAGRLRIVLVVIAVILLFLGITHAWTVLVPTVLVGGLLLFSYFAADRGPAQYLRTRPISWWVMTWFICVAISLTVIGTFFRGPGWSWVWPWRSHGA